MKEGVMKYPYKKIKLSNGKTINEHRYFMERHLGRKLDRYEVVHHRNENPRDNRIENLEIKSLSEHSRDHRIGKPLSEETKQKMSKKMAEKYQGEGHPQSKLTEILVREIRARLNVGVKVRALAIELNLSHTIISQVGRGVRWGHLR